jgi:hypothetical protein
MGVLFSNRLPFLFHGFPDVVVENTGQDYGSPDE